MTLKTLVIVDVWDSMTDSKYKINSQKEFVKQCQKAFDKATDECNKFTNPDDPNVILPMQVLLVTRNVLVQEEEKLAKIERI